MEKKAISHIYHEHLLFLRENVREDSNSSPDCYRCSEPVAYSEMAYVCTEHDCRDKAILHKKCGELPNQISHPSHFKHPLNLFYFNKWNDVDHDCCNICRNDIRNVFGYRCSTCDFNLHIKCAETTVEERKELQHPSHPHHALSLIRKHRFSFYCDGCGDQDEDMAYVCGTCEFLVHKRCASLPDILRVESRHHHPLSLIFSLPKTHRRYRYRCDVCSKYCDASRWAYFCGECRYIAHIKCAIGLSAIKPDFSNSGEDDRDVIELPLHVNDISKKLITPFVMRENVKGIDGATSTSISTGACRDSAFLLKYYHKHPLSLVSEFTHKDDEEEDEEDKEEELKICDVCVTPISSPPYYQCNAIACTYSIHSICSMLPLTLQSSSSSSPDSNSLLILLGECKGRHSKNHNLTLYKSKGSDVMSPSWYCEFCSLPTNGMCYKCGDCEKKIDVKCASLPASIRHASHTRHHHEPLILTKIPPDRARNLCYVCNRNTFYRRNAYQCSHDGCDFALHSWCAILPSSIKDREWDKHSLMLTSDASNDHPSDFFCEFCEQEMHPKNWMYHCRHCDASFHLTCLYTSSGAYKNIKFGKQYKMDGIHPNHHLTFTCVTLKKHCDVCGINEYVYTWLGFECASCYYVACKDCGVKELYRKQKN